MSRLRLVPAALAVAAGAALARPGPLPAQTFLPSKVIEITKCNSIFGLYNRCTTIEKDRLGSSFTQQHLSRTLFGNTWGNASHCTRYTTSEQACARSVSVASDPAWDRITWGLMGTFISAYGDTGSGTGQFRGPMGVDLTRNEGEYHVAFVADAGNNRIVALSLGSTCRCVRWMGTIDGSESGKLLAGPADVAWDPVTTWGMHDDRLFIADTHNHRILVYSVSLDPVNAVMSKTYVGSMGTEGTGQMQLRSPQGIAVRSIRPGQLLTYLAIADSRNERLVSWFMDGTSSLAVVHSGSLALPGSDLVGVTYDFAGDVIVADRQQDRVIKAFGGTLAQLAVYGNGTNSWSSGTFNAPTDVQVVRAYRNVNGLLSTDRLPYVASTEAWTTATGAQSHRLGVDVLNAGAMPGNCSASLSFLLTGEGSYTVSVMNSAGTTVRSWPTVTGQGGWKSQYWDGKNNSGGSLPSGSYTFNIYHESGYTYDDGQPRLSQAGIGLACFSVTASVPSSVQTKGTWAISGTASETADSWRWEQSYNYPGFFMDYAYTRTSSFTTYSAEQASIEWRVHARRTSDGVTTFGTGYTWVDVYCNPYQEICPMSTDPGPVDSAGVAASVQAVSATGGPQLVRVPGQGRLRGHYGSGAWVGGVGADGPQVVQLFSPFGSHDRAGDAWPNPLGGTGAVQESRHGRAPLQVAFTADGGEEGEERYRVRFATRQAGFRDGHVGIAIDPDLGQLAQDDSLGFDPQTGLVWVLDPDSGAVGYLVTGRPAGSRLTVRQFSRRGDGSRADPASDSSAFAELTAREAALTGARDDVRFLIGVGPVALGAADLELGLVVLRAPDLAALRGRAARMVERNPEPTGAGATGITRFRITQAPPQPGARASIERVSPSLIPGLSEQMDPRQRQAPPEGLRDQVRAGGITALAFAVPDGEPARVEIRIHDASGRLVRRLVDSSYDPGAYRVQWDAMDEGGARVAPGVYVAVMEAPGFRSTTRLVVVR